MGKFFITEEEKSKILGMYLLEDDTPGTFVPYETAKVNIAIPYQKDSTGKLQIYPNTWVKLTVVANKGKDITTGKKIVSDLDDYTGISTISFPGTKIIPITSGVKDASGNITGVFGMRNNQVLQDYLKSQLGKTVDDFNKGINLYLNDQSGRKQMVANPVSFTSYEVPAQ
jgi:hypothetical protein